MWQKILIILVLFANTSLWADEYNYQADVKGMVCAFCAYNVSGNISSLPGVDADSIDVDLHGGHATFSSSQIVDEKKLVAVFTDSGFTISNLQVSESGKREKHKDTKQTLVLEFDRTKIAEYYSVMRAISGVVADTTSTLIIMAPQADEEELIKPLLIGQSQVIKIRYLAEDSDFIRIQLFSEK